MLKGYTQRTFEGATDIVKAAQQTTWKERSVGCVSLLVSAVLTVGGVSALALLGYDHPVVLGAVALVGVLPFVWSIANHPDRSVETILANLICPVCKGAMVRDRDAPNDRYVLLCHECRIVWQTDVELSGPGDGLLRIRSI